MLIWIPVDSSDGKNANIKPQLEAKKWALIDFDEGEVQNIEFYNSTDEFDGGWVDFVILANKFENYLDFMNEGLMCLVVREENSIEEIVEAFKFKELDEIGL
jgi:predicted Fe-Mo cluster-binding NifX family protein